jgi:hypothetical protein
MMAAEGPFLAAVIARLPDPKYNLAAHGVAFAFAVLIEAPVIMLMSASTALVEDAVSYRKLRNFANALNVTSTLVLLVVLIPSVFGFLMRTVIGLPSEVADLTYGALWLFLPWPAAIGIRRFVQGVLIRSGRTRLVATGTAIRPTCPGPGWEPHRFPPPWSPRRSPPAGWRPPRFASCWPVRTTRSRMGVRSDTGGYRNSISRFS